MKKYSIAGEVSSEVKENLKGYSELSQILLANRGLKDFERAEVFLKPDYVRDISDPFLILGMDKAVVRILKAIKDNEKIIIYGDYDCDGIPGSVVLHDFFKKIEYKNFENYIPHRHKEGYGLNIPAIEKFGSDGVTLLVTVDSGITDIEQVAHANELGIDMIITDHHLPITEDDGNGGVHDVLPDALTVINSKQIKDTYPDDMLCGAGVAWKLVCALLSRGKTEKIFEVSEDWEKWLLDMAGLSTIADMVPLQKENRAIAYFGLKVLRKSPRAGLQKLLKKSGVNQAHLTEGDVGFMIAPRINAASRMSVPFEAFEMLALEDVEKASALADHLHKINNERKIAVAQIMKEVKNTLSKREIGDVVVIGNPKWRVGVLGIVASNIVDEFDKPAFVWGRGEGTEILKGSCRSDGTANLVELMSGATDGVFLASGGHEFAGGFSVSHEKVHLVEDELNKVYKKVKKEKKIEDIVIDKVMRFDEVTWGTYKDIEMFAPFGVGNRVPLFVFKDAVLAGVKTFGKENNHLELRFQNSRGGNVVAIGFFMTESAFGALLEVGAKINLIASMEKSMFRGRRELRLRIVDIVPDAGL